MNKKEFQELLDKHLQGQSNPQEEELLSKFYGHFQKEEQWPESLGNQQLFGLDLLNDINKSIEKKERSESKERSITFGAFIRIAASILLVVSAGLVGWRYMKNPQDSIVQHEKVTLAGQKSTVVLADGTQVRLNSESKLSFPDQFDADRRVVRLEGEAFFDVVRDVRRPFIIVSGELTTTVLGTSFNIEAFREEDIKVTVATGKVRVQSSVTNKDGKLSEVILTPNQQLHYSLTDSEMEVKEVDLSKYLAWKEGIIRFEKTSLNEAVKVLERWYGVEISLSNDQLGSCVIRNGKYEDENLYNILKSFEYFLDIHFEVLNAKQIRISGNGCGEPSSLTTNN